MPLPAQLNAACGLRCSEGRAQGRIEPQRLFPDDGTPPVTCTIGDAGSALLLQQAGGDSLAVAAAGSFTFAIACLRCRLTRQRLRSRPGNGRR
jgi:hypothetical protein